MKNKQQEVAWIIRVLRENEKKRKKRKAQNKEVKTKPCLMFIEQTKKASMVFINEHLQRT